MPTVYVVSVKYLKLETKYELTLADGSVETRHSLEVMAATLDSVEWTAVQQAVQNPYTTISVK